MVFAESELLPVSALQHLLFCERQCALIHLELQWEENRLTALGRIEHERVDEGYREFRRGRRQIAGLHIRSLQLGLYGRLDVLELDLIDRQGPDNALALGLKGEWAFYPVEFKHGTLKESDCDRVQLCAQALCLEEMMNVRIAEASLFYHKIRRREDVALDARLRQSTLDAASRLQQLFTRGITPPPEYLPHCRSCSLWELCLPKRLDRKRFHHYRNKLFQPQDEP
jgi:CRISPR-associated exonuclease Cas4